MNKQTKEQLLGRLRRRYATAGRKHKIKLIDQAVELLGYLSRIGMWRILRRCLADYTN